VRLRAARPGALLLLALSAAHPGGAEQGPEILFHVQPQRVGVGEPVEITFELPQAGLRPRQILPRFELENLRVVAGPSRHESMTWSGGTLSRRQSVSWTAVADRPGQARVFAVEVSLALETASQPELTLSFGDRVVEVTPEPQRRDRGRSQLASDPFDDMLRGLFGPPRTRPTRPMEEPELLLEAEVRPTHPYVGEQAVYTLYLLAERRRPGEGRVQVETIYPRHVPSFPGFWAQDVPLPQHSRVEVVEREGRSFFRQPVLRRALFPLGEGDHEIAAAEVELRLVAFVPTLFGEEPTRPSPATRQSNPVRLQVRPLPRPPPSFSGAVGSFRVHAGLSPPLVAVGEATTFTLELEGSGNLAAIPGPELPPLAGVRRFPPRRESSVEGQGGSLRSRRSWSWALVPERAGSWELPSQEWSHFDPGSGTYRTLRTPALRLTALGDAPIAEQGPSAPPDPPPGPTTEIDQRPALMLPGSLGPWAAAGLGSAALAMLLVVVAVRRRRPGGPSQRRLTERLRMAGKEQEPRQAAAVAESAWREFLAERWHVPRGAPCSRWAELLGRQGVARPVTDELVELMEDLHYLRYAPELAATAPLREELWQRSRRLLRQLR
jgi:hypothetical protein